MATSGREKAYQIALGVLVLILFAILTWALVDKDRERRAAAAGKNESTRAYEARIQTMNAQWQRNLDQETSKLLQITAVPLSWAVRNEIQAGNMGRVSNYFDELVAHPGVREVIYFNASGVILIATDKGREKRNISELLPPDAVAATKPLTISRGNDQFAAVAPVMGFSQKQGGVVLLYERKPGQ